MLVFCSFVYLVLLPTFFLVMVREAHQSPVGMLLRAEVVTVDDVASFIDERSAELAPGIQFKVIA